MNKKPKLHYCWIILIGTCIMMSVGFGMCLNSVGVFLPFVADSLGVTKGQVSYYMTIQGFGMIIGMYLAGKLIPRKNIKILLSIATILMAVCFFILSGGTHLYHWYIVAIPLGISVAFIAPLPISILISNWFEKKRGLASGIAFAFSGITGSILSPLATKMISAFGWQTTYRFYGLLALVFMLPTAIFPVSYTHLYNPPHNYKNDKDSVRGSLYPPPEHPFYPLFSPIPELLHPGRSNNTAC